MNIPIALCMDPIVSSAKVYGASYWNIFGSLLCLGITQDVEIGFSLGLATQLSMSLSLSRYFGTHAICHLGKLVVCEVFGTVEFIYLENLCGASHARFIFDLFPFSGSRSRLAV